METKKAICSVIGAIGFLNFLAFAIIAGCLGGDALNGKSVDGRYYLSNHGKTVEVSAAVFNYSRIHASSIMVTHPLAILCGFILSSMDRENRSGKSRAS
jgi:hypothetical protein